MPYNKILINLERSVFTGDTGLINKGWYGMFLPVGFGV